MAAVYGGPSDAGPWTAEWSTVDRVHPSPPRRGPGTPGARVGGRRGGCSPIFPAAVLLPAAIFTDEPLWRGWCLIGVGKSFPGPWRLHLRGQGGDQSSLRCWPWRAAARQCLPVARLRTPAPRWLVLGKGGFYGSVGA
jgi:hypothetical protein